MNEFIDSLDSPDGIGGLVSISERDFTFYVGREEWENALGNERRVLFLLAYHYAYLRLASEEDVPHPQFVILDNPFQQDVDPLLVQQGLEQLSRVCDQREGFQVIVATRRRLQNIGAHRISFDRVFNPEPGL